MQEFYLQRSILALFLVLVLHLLAVLVILFLNLISFFTVVAVTVLLFSAFYYGRVLTSGKDHCVVKISRVAEGQWFVTSKSGEWVAVVLQKNHVITRYFVLLRFKQRNLPHTNIIVIIWPDVLSKGELRELRLLLSYER